MSVRRLAATTAAMAAVAAVLCVVAPRPAAVVAVLTAPQRLVDLEGPEALVVAVAGGLAWLAWAWGALGLLLTAVGTVPGAVGAPARFAQRALVPVSGRRAAAVVLGLGIGLTGPGGIVAAAAATGPSPAAADPTAAPPVPDWPTTTASPATPAPDRQTADATAPHRVEPGDCLWHIAESRLRGRDGGPPTNAEIAAGVRAWWHANAAVIGPDPDLLLPGQVLRPPEAP